VVHLIPWRSWSNKAHKHLWIPFRHPLPLTRECFFWSVLSSVISERTLPQFKSLSSSPVSSSLACSASDQILYLLFASSRLSSSHSTKGIPSESICVEVSFTIFTPGEPCKLTSSFFYWLLPQNSLFGTPRQMDMAQDTAIVRQKGYLSLNVKRIVIRYHSRIHPCWGLSH